MSTTVTTLDGTTLVCTVSTVGELKKEYERVHGVPAHIQTVWAFSSGLELNDTVTLDGEDQVQLAIDRQTVTVCVDDRPYEIECQHENTVDDVRQVLETQHGITDVAFALDADVYDANGIVTMDAVAAMELPVHKYVERPLRLARIHFGEIRELGKIGRFKSCKSFVHLGATKLTVQTPWLRSVRGIHRHPTRHHNMLDVYLDGYNGTDQEVTTLYNVMNMIQNRFIDECCKTYYKQYLDRGWHNPQLVTGSNQPERVVCLFAMNRIIRCPQPQSNTAQEPPSMSFTVLQQDGYWHCYVRNLDTGETVTGDLRESIRGPVSVRAVIQCTDLWCLGGQWGTTWVALSLDYRALPKTE